jgi:ABC-type arginine transport system permease subunit
MKSRLPEILAVLLFFAAIVVLVHQQLITESEWFNWQQFLHHESFAACFFVAAISLLLGKYLDRVTIKTKNDR